MKRWFIAAGSFVLIGCILFAGAMSGLHWDFTQLSTVKYETNSYEITKAYQNISIQTDTADLVILPSKTDNTCVVCHEQETMKHSVTVKDNTLVVEMIDTRKWYEHISIHFGAPKITVYLPKGDYGTLAVKSSTGNIVAENISADMIDLSVSTGKITLNDTACQSDIRIQVSTGKSKLTNVTCKNLTSRGSTGDLVLNKVTATDMFSLERSTGDVTFDKCDAAEIVVKTDTGDVVGSLLTNKVFLAQTDTGKVDVPKTINGGKCEITTDTGDIRLKIE